MSSRLISGLCEKNYDKYMDMSQSEFEEINTHEVKTVERRIRELIAEYNTFKLLLADAEYKLENLRIEYDIQFMQLKEKYMNGELAKYKSTEAKEHANSDLRRDKMNILAGEREISLLKANIHSTEYQLRLKYLQLENKNKFKPDIQDILEAR